MNQAALNYLTADVESLTDTVHRNTRYVTVIIQHMADSCPHCQGTGRIFRPAAKPVMPDAGSLLAWPDHSEEVVCEVCAGLRQIIKEQP